MERLGVNIRNTNANTKNLAAVMVTADLPAFATPGSRVDVAVSAMGKTTDQLVALARQVAANPHGRDYAEAAGRAHHQPPGIVVRAMPNRPSIEPTK